MYELARTSLKKNAKRQKRDYDTRLSTQVYQEGDLVLCLNKAKTKGKSKKIDPNIWEGPFQIIQRISDLLYKVQLGRKSKTKIIHHDRLKPYTGNRIPDWCVQKRFPVTTEIVKGVVKGNKILPKPVRHSLRQRKPVDRFQS